MAGAPGPGSVPTQTRQLELATDKKEPASAGSVVGKGKLHKDALTPPGIRQSHKDALAPPDIKPDMTKAIAS